MSQLLVSKTGGSTQTKNPLLYRNKTGQLVFGNYNDLKKFSVKFNVFKDSYQENECVREVKASQSTIKSPATKSPAKSPVAKSSIVIKPTDKQVEPPKKKAKNETPN